MRCTGAGGLFRLVAGQDKENELSVDSGIRPSIAESRSFGQASERPD
jgi:hypothetical protein